VRISTIIAGRQFFIERNKDPFVKKKSGGGYYNGANHIVLNENLRDEEELEVLVHESMHAHDMELPEDFVEMLAKDITQALWDYGYRVEHPELRI